VQRKSLEGRQDALRYASIGCVVFSFGTDVMLGHEMHFDCLAKLLEAALEPPDCRGYGGDWPSFSHFRCPLCRTELKETLSPEKKREYEQAVNNWASTG
jgi:hypothetical protein